MGYAYLSIAVSEQEQVFTYWDLSDSCLKLLIECIFSFGCRAECRGVNAEVMSVGPEELVSESEMMRLVPCEGDLTEIRRELRTAKPTP